MIYQLVVPGQVEDVEEMRVLEWHGEVGRVFAEGELIVELETYKAAVEVRSGQRGVLRRVLCAPGDWQKVGKPLALLSDDPAELLPASPDALAPWLVNFEIT
ncbi:MAG: 2-oxoglutarate dehydrogenase [Aromatoleum sp.]|nr:2-oxoglutarate dehydrogenase [Aromatoleum sp.]